MIFEEDNHSRYTGLGGLLMQDGITQPRETVNPPLPNSLPESIDRLQTKVRQPIPVTHFLEQALSLEPELDPDDTRQYIDIVRNMMVLAGQAFKDKIPEGQIAERKVKQKKVGDLSTRYETVTVGKDKHRVLHISPDVNPDLFRIHLKKQYALAQNSTRLGLEHNGFTHKNDAQKEKDIVLWSSAKYHDQVTYVDIAENSSTLLQKDEEVVTLKQFEERVLSDGPDAIIDGELIAAVAVQKYRNELKGIALFNGHVEEYLKKFLQKTISLPTLGKSPWYDVEKKHNDEVGETHEIVSPTTNEVLSVLAFTKDRKVNFQLQYEPSPAQYYYKVLLTSGGGKEINEDTQEAAAREAEQEVGANSSGKKVERLGLAFHRSDVVKSSSQAYLILNPDMNPTAFSGDEEFHPEPQTFSLVEIKKLIASGLITDVGTIVALYKAILRLQKDGYITEELNKAHLTERKWISPLGPDGKPLLLPEQRSR